MILEHPLKNFSKTYRLETVVISNPDTSYRTEKSYVRVAEVYYLGNEKEYFRYHVLVVDFNFSNDDNAMGKFLKQISYLFDELELTVDKDGHITEINNLNFLRLRWAKIAAKLSETHKGDSINNYFRKIGSILEDKSMLIGFLEGYNMFGLLFNGLLQPLDAKRKKRSSEEFTEIITPVKDGDKMILTISAEDPKPSGIDDFRGLFVFREGHNEEGFMEIKKDNTHLKHSLLWIG